MKAPIRSKIPAPIPMTVGVLTPAAGKLAGEAVFCASGVPVLVGVVVAVEVGVGVDVGVTVGVLVGVEVGVAVVVGVDVGVIVGVTVGVLVPKVNTSCVQELSSGLGVDVEGVQLFDFSDIPPQSQSDPPLQLTSSCHFEQIVPSPFSNDSPGPSITVSSSSLHTLSSQQSRW